MTKKRTYKVTPEQEAYRNSLLSKKAQVQNRQRNYRRQTTNPHAFRWQSVVPPDTLPAHQVRKVDLHRLAASWRQFQTTEAYRSAAHRLKKETIYEIFSVGFFHSLAYAVTERGSTPYGLQIFNHNNLNNDRQSKDYR